MLQMCYGHWPACPAVAVGVAQLVERQTVDLDVAGSNPVTHPMFQFSSLRIFRTQARCRRRGVWQQSWRDRIPWRFAPSLAAFGGLAAKSIAARLDASRFVLRESRDSAPFSVRFVQICA